MICQVLENLKAKYMIGFYIYRMMMPYLWGLIFKMAEERGIIRFNAPFHCSVVTEVEQWVKKVSIKWQSLNA